MNVILPPEKPVQCECPSGFQFSILIQTNYPDFYHCLKCGRVEVSIPLVEEPGRCEVILRGHKLMPISEEMRAWLADWPVLLLGPTNSEDYVLVPSKTRAHLPQEVISLVQQFKKEQVGLSFRQRILKCGFPASPAPSEEKWMKQYIEIQRGLQLPAEIPLVELINLGSKEFEVSVFQEMDLSARIDYRREVLRLAKSEIHNEWRRGFDLIERHHWTFAEVEELILMRLKIIASMDGGAFLSSGKGTTDDPTKTSEPSWLLQVLIRLVEKLKFSKVPFKAAVSTLQIKIDGEKEYYLKRVLSDWLR